MLDVVGAEIFRGVDNHQKPDDRHHKEHQRAQGIYGQLENQGSLTRLAAQHRQSAQRNSYGAAQVAKYATDGT